MSYIGDVIASILLEEVQQNVLVNAIKKRHEVSFIYDSRDGDSRGKKERIVVQPVCYGLTKSQNPCFRAYQINGSSESAEKKEGVIPGWRLFLLDRVVSGSWKDSGKVFSKPPMYNESGDDTMSEIFVKADFAGSAARYERGGLKRYNDERHKKNVEKNQFYDFEKQLKKKTIAPDYVLKNIADTSKTDKEREREWKLATTRTKGNLSSIAAMSRQKNFGDEESQQTVGPKRKGQTNELPKNPNANNLNYQNALQNGPKYKGINTKEINNNNDNKEDENGYKLYNGESPETNA